MPELSETKVTVNLLSVHEIGNRLRNEDLLIPHVPAEYGDALEELLPFVVSQAVEKGQPHSLPDELAEHCAKLQTRESFNASALWLSNRLFGEIDEQRVPKLQIVYSSLQVEWNGQREDLVCLFALEQKSTMLSVALAADKSQLRSLSGVPLSSINTILLYLPSKKEAFIGASAQMKKIWCKKFLAAQPRLTEKLKSKYATEVIKGVSKHLENNEQADQFKESINELVQQADSFAEEDLSECCRRYVSDEDYEAVREKAQKRVECSVPADTPLTAAAVEKKLARFIKSIQLSGDLALTISGKKELQGVERLSEDPEAGTYVIKLTLKR